MSGNKGTARNLAKPVYRFESSQKISEMYWKWFFTDRKTSQLHVCIKKMKPSNASPCCQCGAWERMQKWECKQTFNLSDWSLHILLPLQQTSPQVGLSLSTTKNDKTMWWGRIASATEQMEMARTLTLCPSDRWQKAIWPRQGYKGYCPFFDVSSCTVFLWNDTLP